ncbi:MAG TPA: kelch repeat-containing protein [Bacteroidia bacterium]|nr:kelch repeat-containing protein [Bacteroidia bacterium]
MKKILLIFNFAFLIFNSAFPQAGEWVWIKGDSVPNQPGNFGVQGVSSPTNKPPSLYEPCEWTDLNGNFWLFGGSPPGSSRSDLWKYDPLTNEWTWMKGNNIPNDPGNYGTLGIPSPANNPPARGYGATSWVDSSGNFWMLGGANGTGGNFSDLWRYTISTNEWTWMKGPNITNQLPVYGIQGVPDPANTPGSFCESSTAWIDYTTGNLWFYAGGYTNNADLWQFNISTSEWTWIKGGQIANQPPIYGIKSAEDSVNTPGKRQSYAHWKDSNGKFWMFAGFHMKLHNDVWRYNPVTNNWAWINGDSTTTNVAGNYGQKCVVSSSNVPGLRYENRACWSDQKGDFFVFGGGDTFGGHLNDLWKYCIAANQWVWVSGDTTSGGAGNWGTIGVSSPLNKPNERMGSVGWTDNNNHLYLFGGASNPWFSAWNDLWKYSIDTTCGVCPAPNSTEENNPPKTDELLVFPNPTNSSLTISFSSSEKQTVELRIYNTLGEVQLFQSFVPINIGMEKGFSKEINVEKLGDGIYFLQLKTKEGIVSKKVVVQH